jgi:hypothetical protein
MLSDTVFYGSVINPQTLYNYQALPRSLLAVSASGTIEWIVENTADPQMGIDSWIREIISQKGLSDVEIVMLKHGEFLMPGFVDTHTVRQNLTIEHRLKDASLARPASPKSRQVRPYHHPHFFSKSKAKIAGRNMSYCSGWKM